MKALESTYICYMFCQVVIWEEGGDGLMITAAHLTSALCEDIFNTLIQYIPKHLAYIHFISEK